MRRLPFLFLLAFFPAPALSAADPPEPNYVFWSKFVRIIDGDTVAMDLDLGFGVWVHNQTLSLLESGGAGQDEKTRAMDNERVKKLRELFADATDIVVRTVRDRDAKPPRYYAEIWIDGTNLNEEMRKSFP